MKAGWVGMLAAALALAGCTSDEPANPNLAAPKVVIAPLPDGNVTVYVHSAFGERMYEWIRLAVDNETVANETVTFALERAVPSDAFFLEVAAEIGDQVYRLQARVDIDRLEERAEVSVLTDQGEWTEPRAFGLPYERILDRPEA